MRSRRNKTIRRCARCSSSRRTCSTTRFPRAPTKAPTRSCARGENLVSSISHRSRIGKSAKRSARSTSNARPNSRAAVSWRCAARALVSRARSRSFFSIAPAIRGTRKWLRRCSSAARRCGRRVSSAKFADAMFGDADAGLYMIPTAEVPLTALHGNEILAYDELPKQYAAFTPCFRKEAGAAGKDTRGLIRLHQFEKVELVWLTTPESSPDALERLTGDAEALLRALDLPLPRGRAVRGRRRFQRRQDLRHRGVAAERGRVSGGQFVFRTAPIFKRGARRCASGVRRRQSRSSYIRSTAPDYRSAGRWPQFWRTISKPTDRLRYRRRCGLTRASTCFRDSRRGRRPLASIRGPTNPPESTPRCARACAIRRRVPTCTARARC